jgi:hypothetical protein
MLFQMGKWVLPGTGVLNQKSGICGDMKRGTAVRWIEYSLGIRQVFIECCVVIWFIAARFNPL